MKAARVVAAGLLVSSLCHVHAQMDHPKMLRIVRERVKPGRGSDHARIESAFAQVLTKAGFANYIGLESITGANEAWFVEAFDSWSSIQEALGTMGKEPLRSELSALAAQEGDVLQSDNSVVAMLQKELSYLPGTFHPASARFLYVYSIRIRPGHTPEFAERAKLLNDARAKAGWKGEAAVYRIESGAPEGTYLVLLPAASLQELDAGPNELAAMRPEDVTRFRKINEEIVLESGYTLFAINPKMSNPSKALVDADPGFWKR